MSHSTFKMPSEAKLNAWKKDHNAIHKITPDPNRPEIFCIVRHPKLNDISSSSELGGNDQVKIGIVQLNDCWLDGDVRIKTDIELLRAAALKMGAIFKVYDYSLEFLPVTADVLKSIPADKLDRVKADGEVRKLTVTVMEDQKPVKKSAWLCKPDMFDVEKAETTNDPLSQGTIYLQECWLSGCKDLKEGDDETRFAAYLAALGIFRRFTATVEKL